MRGLVITGGEFPAKNIISDYAQSDLIIAADSGFDNAIKLGINCDYLIGDLDSISSPALKKIDKSRIIKYPSDKDLTDTELAFNLAKKSGCEEIIIVGGGGGRFDHLLAIFRMFARDDAPDLWITKNDIVILIKKTYTISRVKGKTFSFFPISDEKCKMSSEGLKWPLDNLIWGKGDFGISNIAISDRVTVNVSKGKLVCVRPIQ